MKFYRRNASIASALCLLFLVAVVAPIAKVDADEWKPKIAMEQSQSKLFEISHEIEVSSPSFFPKPTYPLNDPDAVVVVEPQIGQHRPEQDAVMAYAEGYTVEYYMCFIETLRATGFDGDIVFATSEYDLLKPNVLEYLKMQKNLVVYIHKLDCFEADGLTPSKRIEKRGAADVFQMCLLNDVYGKKDKDGKVIETAKDPRIGRVVATLRYEWYWIWAQHYNPDSWIMLVDARDSIFQTNPFKDLPRQQNGLLYFFGENAEATRIGKSTKNRNWILRSYGLDVLNALTNKPTICSGSTMGEQIAIETYLKALVNEWDETDIKMTGADQGFHNYLYYSGKLANSQNITKLVVWEQGKGIINNLGALRTKPFWEWGFYNNKTKQVYNWDGTLSPVAHQWDRDKDMHTYYMQKHRKWKESFQEEQRKKEGGNLRATAQQ
uniref:Nucleotide-diphospho-sugar transferase domain-containing protein n=1 Tax=Pseudo-nitzschia australis TaxID=44445 RepID=A0A7S4ELX4_9STRA|mmetsp:Transcript_19519/g.42424  ORF Transcript_19519/g.42424 Transcript_19519/m.42424 type:complete len:436 (-) Transcript_19519:312-1619(-)